MSAAERGVQPHDPDRAERGADASAAQCLQYGECQGGYHAEMQTGRHEDVDGTGVLEFLA